MQVLIIGANGFIGKNLVAKINRRGFADIYAFDTDTEHRLCGIENTAQRRKGRQSERIFFGGNGYHQGMEAL